MTEEKYLKIKEFLLNHRKVLYTAATLNKLSEVAVYFSYILFLVLLIINKNLYCIQSMTVCGVGFVLLTVYRKHLNTERPYEKFDFVPLIKKETEGCSFPSRHAFSAAVIGTSLLPIYSAWGTVLLMLAALMAVLRVVLGLHFIKDTLAGFLIGVAFGLLCFV